MTEEVEVETRQIYLIQTEGPEGMHNTEVKFIKKSLIFDLMIQKVVITDLGEIGENAIIVFEESVGVGAEEIVANQEYVTFTDPENEVMQVNQGAWVRKMWHLKK